MADQQKVIVCFDGSEGSTHALDLAARLFPGAHATIVVVWRPAVPFGGVGYGGTFILPPDIQDDIKTKAQEDAEKLADDGASHARTAGLVADTDVRETTGPVWRELLGAADDADADAIVVGSRGFGEIKALMLGSTSQALAHHAKRPLVIVPTPHDPGT